MQNQLKSSLILLDNIFFGKVKFTRNTYAEKLSELGFPNSNTTISRILKDIKDNFGFYVKFPKNSEVFIENELSNNEDFNQYHFLKSLLFYGKIKNIDNQFINDVIIFSSDSKFANYQLIFEILESIQQRFYLKIEYKKFDEDKIRTYKLKPKFIKEYLGRWYLVSDSELHINQVFGIDRIIKLERINQKFDVDFKDLKIYDNTIGVTYSNDLEKIVLWVEMFQLNLFKTYPIHHSQQIISEDKNGGIISFTVNINYELKQLLASYLLKVKILEPEHLKNEMINVYKKIVENYEIKL